MVDCNTESLRLIVEGLTQTIGHDIRAGILFSFPPNEDFIYQ